MAMFQYLAKTMNGQEMRGEVDAANEAEARVKIRAQRLIPLELRNLATAKKAGPPRFGGGVSMKDLQVFTRQLATLLNSGIPILQSLDVLGRGVLSPGLNFALKEIISSVSQGKRFAEALAEHPKVFDKFYCNMVRAGEESGNMDSVLQRLAVYIEKAAKISGKIKGAMVYPAAIMVVAGGVVTALMIFVIPKFVAVFANTGQELPALTQWVVAASKFFVGYWWLIFAGVGGLVYGIKAYYETPTGRRVLDKVLIETPLMGALIQKGGMARFSRTLSTLLESGVGIMESLDIASKVVGSTVLEDAVLKAKDSIAEGKSLTAPLSQEKYIPSMVVQMIGVGEQTGNMDQMLGKVADFYEEEVDTAVSALTSMMEPLLMVVLGGIIAVIVVAMYLPIFNMANAMG